MRNIIKYFINYPIAGWLIVIAFTVLGLAGVSNLKSSFFPLIENRNISINVIYPGASPQEMEEGIILKIEDNLKGIVGIDRFTSTSKENSANISIEILKGYDIDATLSDVKNAVNKIPSFPSDMEPPIIAKQIFTSDAISIVLSGENIPLMTLKSFGRKVEDDLRSFEGISQINVSGYPDEEIEIALNEDKMRAYQLTFQEIAAAVTSTNILVTGGSIKTSQEEYLIRVSNRKYYGVEFDQIVLKSNKNGKLIRLQDIAVITDKWSESPDRAYFNGKPSVQLNVKATISEDLIEVAENVKAYVTNFNNKNDNLQLAIISDRSVVVVERINLLLKNALQGIILVLIFLALFLKPRLAFWVAFGLPFAFLGMFIFAGFFNVTINIVSLFGMIIVIGILVDDGIVISENIYHHYEKGKTRMQAAIDGTMEVLPAITSAILTTLVAFSSFFFLEGRIGEFFGETATIVILTLGLSLIEALIILPSHISHSKSLTKAQKTYWFNAYADQFMSWMRDNIYAPTLSFYLKNKVLGFGITLGLLVLTLGSMGGGIIKFSFFPQIASDRLQISLKMPQGTNEAVADSIIAHIENQAWKVNDSLSKLQTGNLAVIQNIIRRVGPGTSVASLTINLLSGEARDAPAYLVSSAIDKKVGSVDGAETLIYGSGNYFGGKPISVSLLSNNTQQLKEAKLLVKNYLKENNLLKDIEDNDPAGIKEIKLELTENGYAMGFRLNTLISQVRSGFFGYQAQRFQRRRDEIKVWVRYDKETRSSLASLEEMRVVSPLGVRVPLREVANYQIQRGEISINHLDGDREIRIDADLKNPKTSATEIIQEIKTEVLPIINAQYPSVRASFDGQSREANKTTSSAAATMPIVFFMIFAIIAFTYRSISQPLLLMIMIPFSLIGVAWGHWLHGFPINISSFLGIIALIGIVVNDGLVLIGKFNSNLRAGMKFDNALLEAGKSRFRPIFLTSITTVAGLGPLIFEKSLQAQFLIPMAVSIAYGILVATLLTLVFLPMLLAFGNTMKVWTIWLWNGTKPEKESVERAVKELNINHE